ncbi:hypothetical protein K1W54_06840 [Micromonospora sp. CPCC 205371]|nr:hypothetical protein [Micromonospora sp. CPCC 205371]
MEITHAFVRIDDAVGRVGAALRRAVGNEAADTFNRAAYACTSYDEVLHLALATVTVS